jgi:hypothetical protein
MTTTVAGRQFATRRLKGGVLFLDSGKQPFAFLVIRPTAAWFVTAHRASGQTFFMQGFADYTARQLGIEHLSYSAQRDLARELAASEKKP